MEIRLIPKIRHPSKTIGKINTRFIGNIIWHSKAVNGCVVNVLGENIITTDMICKNAITKWGGEIFLLKKEPSRRPWFFDFI